MANIVLDDCNDAARVRAGSVAPLVGLHLVGVQAIASVAQLGAALIKGDDAFDPDRRHVDVASVGLGGAYMDDLVRRRWWDVDAERIGDPTVSARLAVREW